MMAFSVAFFNWARTLLGVLIGSAASREIHSNMSKKVLRAPLGFFGTIIVINNILWDCHTSRSKAVPQPFSSYDHNHAISVYFLSVDFTPFHVTLFHVTLFYVTLFHVTLFHVTLFHVTLFHVTLFHVTLFHVTLFYVTLFYVTSIPS